MDGDPGIVGLELRIARLEARVGDLEAEVATARRREGRREPMPAAAPPAPHQPGHAPSAVSGWGTAGDRPLHPLPPAPLAPPATPAEPNPPLPDWGWVSRPRAGSSTAGGAVARPDLGTPAGVNPWLAVSAAHRSKPPVNLRDLEERFAGQALAWIGGLALVAAAVFFLSLAFSRGWITEPMRVAIGFAAAGGALAVGALSFDRRNPLLGDVLTAAGLGIASITLFAATRAYGLLAPEAGLLAALVAAVAAAAIAIRYDAREVAVFGLVAALIAPPVMGASPTLLTLLFVAVTLVGTTAIALFRSWRWLPPTAFVLAAPQFASWLLGQPDLAQALVALAAFWLVNIVAAGGEEVRIRRDDLRPSSATLTLANAAFAVWGGTVVLSGPYHPWLGAYVALAALAHFGVGAAFLRRQGLEHLFGNLVAGTGVALLALAAFIQLGAALVPVAWAAEAAALAWLAARRAHRWSALAATVLGGLAVLHLLVVEYPLDHVTLAGAWFADPLLHPEAGSLAAVVAATAFAGRVAPVAWIRSVLAALGTGLVAYGALFEASGPALTGLLVLAALVALALDLWIDALGTRADFARLGAFVPGVWLASAAALAIGVVAIAHLLGVEYVAARLPDVPYVDAPSASLAFLLTGLAVAGGLFGTRRLRSALGAVAVLLVAWSLWFELGQTAAIAVAAVLLPLAVVGDHALGRLPDARRLAFLPLPPAAADLMTVAGGAAWAYGLAVAAVVPLSPGRWGSALARPFTDDATLVAIVLAGAALAAAAWLGQRDARQLAVLGSLVPVALVCPIEVGADLVVVVWLALAGIAAATRGVLLRPLALLVAAVLASGALVAAFGIVVPPDRLWVGPGQEAPRSPLLPAWWLAVLAVALAPLAATRMAGLAPYRVPLAAAAVVAGVYLVSVGVVSPFDRMIGGVTATEELAKQAQVAMSVAWTAIGAVALAIGLRTRWGMPRHIGFGLLAAATLKVFTVDLAAMDVAYRAVVLAGLGVLLLVSAWLFTHLRGPRAGAPGGPRIPGARPAG